MNIAAVRMTLQRRILNNELAAGERLIEANLAAEFGVSRTTLRAALMELAELWHALDGQMGALMRSWLEFQGGDLSEVVARHHTLIDAVRTADRDVMAAAIKDHYLNARSVHDHDVRD